MRRRGTARLIAASVIALTFAAGTAVPAAAASAQPTAQDNFEYWWSAYGVDAAHAAGLTGKGVKVAVIEKQINPDLPVFQGRNLRVSPDSLCVNNPTVLTTDANNAAIHGATVTAYVIGNGTGAGSVRGIAPDADVTFYGIGPDGGPACETADGNVLTDFGAGVKKAVDEGARIIFTATDGSARQDDAPAIAYALARGTIIVSASLNPGTLGSRDNDQGSLNGVVSTAAFDRDANLQQDNGAPFVIPQTTVVAAGFSLPTVGNNGAWDSAGTATGSSFAAPIVAGMLTLAAQKSPEATGNQLVQALIATTNASVHSPKLTDDGYGYGAAWLPTLLSVDPSTYPDTSPLMDKAAGFPTAEQIAEAQANGYSPPQKERTIDQYRQQNGSAAIDISNVILWAVIGLGAVVVAAIVVTVLIIVSQRRKARKERSA